jgi:glycolate oxidase iron-sulfur subunit
MLYHCAMNDLSATNRCVKCGLCLPHCPTFLLTGNEADSPRGRISLMQAIDQHDAQYTAGLFRHLDQCLLCGSCEAMCPSGVPFGRLMDAARAIVEPHRKRPTANRLLRRLALQALASRRWTSILSTTARFHQRLGLQRLVDRTPGLSPAVKRLSRLIPAPAHQGSVVPESSPVPAQRGRVNLFRGCAGTLFDQRTLNAAQRLLESLGYRVNIPARQGCCGALHQHNGDPAAAARLAEANQMAFGTNSDPILVTASGCAAHLTAYGGIYGRQAAEDFAQRTEDILHFLKREGRQELRFKRFAEKLAVYIPCTHRNVLRQQQDILDVLSWIPGAQAYVVNPNGGCCGAAGSYMLTQTELAERLRRPLIEVIDQAEARLLLTTNIGCAIHLQAGLRERGLAIEVLHPVALLDRLQQH